MTLNLRRQIKKLLLLAIFPRLTTYFERNNRTSSKSSDDEEKLNWRLEFTGRAKDATRSGKTRQIGWGTVYIIQRNSDGSESIVDQFD